MASFPEGVRGRAGVTDQTETETGTDKTGNRIVTGTDQTGNRIVIGTDQTGNRIVIGIGRWSGPDRNVSDKRKYEGYGSEGKLY